MTDPMTDPWYILATKLAWNRWLDAEVQVQYDSAFRSAARAAMDSVLNEQERTVLELRCGLKGGRVHTLEETGRELGFTRERIRQIEARALRKLRGRGLQKMVQVRLGEGWKK